MYGEQICLSNQAQVLHKNGRYTRLKGRPSVGLTYVCSLNLNLIRVQCHHAILRALAWSIHKDFWHSHYNKMKEHWSGYNFDTDLSMSNHAKLGAIAVWNQADWRTVHRSSEKSCRDKIATVAMDGSVAAVKIFCDVALMSRGGTAWLIGGRRAIIVALPARVSSPARL
jgi:hypothetical protein